MKNKKLILNKNTVKRLNVQTNIQTGAPADETSETGEPGRTYSCSTSIRR